MATTATREQERWNEIVRDPALRDLPYKVETNEHGQLILSPHQNRHSRYQKALLRLLDEHAPPGESYPEYALAADRGVKTPGVVWASPEREREMIETGDPSTLAPEICVEVLSASNTADEMAEKRRLYRAAGAEEVWLVGTDGHIRFFREEEIEQSDLAPSCPTHASPER